jgi:hypothetical protein
MPINSSNEAVINYWIPGNPSLFLLFLQSKDETIRGEDEHAPAEIGVKVQVSTQQKPDERSVAGTKKKLSASI